jgi:nucleoid-associated protein YgaU
LENEISTLQQSQIETPGDQKRYYYSPEELVSLGVAPGAVITAEQGYTIWGIAVAAYGSPDFISIVAEAAAVDGRPGLQLGETITLPSWFVLNPPDQSGGLFNPIDSSQMFGSPDTTITVVEGMTMWEIAEYLWGDGSLWTHISEANNGLAANQLVGGMTLVIPSLN